MRMRNGLRSCMRTLSSSPPRALPCRIPTIACKRRKHTHASITVNVTGRCFSGAISAQRKGKKPTQFHYFVCLEIYLALHFRQIAYLQRTPFIFFFFFLVLCIFTLRLPHNRLKSGTDGLCRTNLFPVDRAPIFIPAQMAKSQTRKQDKKHFQKMFEKTKLPFSGRSAFLSLQPLENRSSSHARRAQAIWSATGQITKSARVEKSPGEPGSFFQRTVHWEQKGAKQIKKNPREVGVVGAGDQKNQGPIDLLTNPIHTHKQTCAHLLQVACTFWLGLFFFFKVVHTRTKTIF